MLLRYMSPQGQNFFNNLLSKTSMKISPKVTLEKEKCKITAKTSVKKDVR